MDDRDRRPTDPDHVPAEDTLPEEERIRPPADEPIPPRDPVAGDPAVRTPTNPTGVPPRQPAPPPEPAASSTWIWVLVIAVVILAILWLTGVIGGNDVPPEAEGPVVPVEDQVAPADAQDEVEPELPEVTDPAEPFEADGDGAADPEADQDLLDGAD